MIDEITTVFGTETRKARKPHKCCECGGTIDPGESYVYHHGVWSEGPASYKVCPECEELRTEVDAEATDDYERTAFTELLESVLNSGDQDWLRRYVANRERRGATVPQWMKERIEKMA